MLLTPMVFSFQHAAHSNRLLIPLIPTLFLHFFDLSSLHPFSFLNVFNKLIYIYIYPSQSTIVASIDCAIGKMAHPIRQNLLGQRKQVLIDKYARQSTPYEFFFTLSHLVVPVVLTHRSFISILMLTLNYNTAALARLVAAFQCMPFWDSENRCRSKTSQRELRRQNSSPLPAIF